MTAINSLVCISHVPDTTTKIKYDSEGKSLDKTGVTFVINPYDEFGLVRAIEIQEASGGQGKITALCLGRIETEPTIRKALAIGANEGARIDADPTDGFFVASQIAAYAKDKNFDLLFFGKESIDHNGSEVPGMVAEILGLPFVSMATHLEVQEKKAILHREVDGGYEVIECQMPLVLSCQKGMAEWRIANMRGITASRSKPLAVVPPVPVDPATTTVKLQQPPEKSGCIFINPETPEKLIEALHEKGLI